MLNNINKMNIKEFRESGFLQELNRLFLHPLGLALEVAIGDDGNEFLGGIWDYRCDEEGIYYDLEHSDKKRIKSFDKKRKIVKQHRKNMESKRLNKLGFVIEPIKKNNK